jgi:hypothetical protein
MREKNNMIRVRCVVDVDLLVTDAELQELNRLADGDDGWHVVVTAIEKLASAGDEEEAVLLRSGTEIESFRVV